ncbi:hypothetical protein MCUN1_001734 [Malassezia cuniculi]|uniref:Methyltransferase type 11 domain-containing protein n=1 Tax=Malassezia cuniculi TaxID=948313 RepID=A0AAF0J6A6_9BASI|nr:hypothetical protein MCUN1_001734 [Malassezia cuniculi]
MHRTALTRGLRAFSSRAFVARAAETAPPPGTPYYVFDRYAKRMQRSRAAERGIIKDNAVQPDTRGEPSRLTDYVRDFGAECLAERLMDITRPYPTIVELGAGAGHLRHHIGQRPGLEKLIMCDTSESLLNRDRHLDKNFPFEIERRVIDEEMLPFEPDSLDCVVASGSLHWTNDLPGALAQIQRALKPDGVFLGYMLGGDTLFELRTSLLLAEQERRGGMSVRVSPMAESRDISSLLSRAGFTLQTVDVDELKVGYPTMYELMQDLRDMGESNAAAYRATFLPRDVLLAAGATYAALHGEEDHVPATYSMIFMIGWKPSPEQRAPLKPGSATHSLKDIL